MTVFALPLTAHASDHKGKVVRVGWYESTFSYTDESGRRTGYDYVYEQKIASYTGWTYEYIDGSWPELLEKLKNGEIDMLGDVSHTEERAEILLYPSLPMGTEDYYIFVTPKNTELTQGGISVFYGKKVGVNKGSVQENFLLEWIEKNAIEMDIVELTASEAQAFEMVEKGEIDALVTVDGFGDPEKAVPVFKVGYSDYFFAVSNQRPDIHEELEQALKKINEENRYFNQQLHERYVKSTGASLYLNDAEKAWLSSHGAVKVGYLDNYLPFCAKEEDTNELTGALKDYLDYASDVIVNAELNFETICYKNQAEALEALRKGEIDCIFPSNLSVSDGEEMGLVFTTPS